MTAHILEHVRSGNHADNTPRPEDLPPHHRPDTSPTDHRQRKHSTLVSQRSPARQRPSGGCTTGRLSGVGCLGTTDRGVQVRLVASSVPHCRRGWGSSDGSWAKGIEMQPAELHERIRDGVNAADVDALVKCCEPDAVLMAEDGAQAVGLDEIRAAYEAIMSFGGTLTLETRYAVERGELALTSNQYTCRCPAIPPVGSPPKSPGGNPMGCGSTSWTTPTPRRRRASDSHHCVSARRRSRLKISPPVRLTVIAVAQECSGTPASRVVARAK